MGGELRCDMNRPLNNGAPVAALYAPPHTSIGLTVGLESSRTTRPMWHCAGASKRGQSKARKALQ